MRLLSKARKRVMNIGKECHEPMPLEELTPLFQKMLNIL
jgi:hypothetical protein